MKRAFAILACLLIGVTSHAGQSKIVTASGKACMGDDKSRKQTEQEALIDAKRRAIEYTLTHLKAETTVKNFRFEKDLVEAYAHASVRILQEMDSAWFKDEAAGACFRTTIKAEVIPEEEKIQFVVNNSRDDPSAPLSVEIWTDKKSYGKGEKMTIFMKGNKHFYARVIYRNTAGDVLQILPNPYRKNNFFSSGSVHELPSGDDRYDIEVIPPFGTEVITVFGSTAQLGEIELQEKSAVYAVKTKAEDIAIKTRGVALVGRSGSEKDGTADFAEARVIVSTENK
jgi:uncharacterized protein DUF4384